MLWEYFLPILKKYKSKEKEKKGHAESYIIVNINWWMIVSIFRR